MAGVWLADPQNPSPFRLSGDTQPGRDCEDVDRVTQPIHTPQYPYGIEAVMYTLWSKGELLGESELGYVRVFPRLRTGDLKTTPKGLIAIERLTQTHADSHYSARRLTSEKLQDTVGPSDEKTLLADLAAEADQYEALALELRAPDGSVIATESIYVADTDYLQAIDSERDEEDEFPTDVASEDLLDSDDRAALQQQLEEFEEDYPPWVQPAPEREPVRFQISVTVKDEWAIP